MVFNFILCGLRVENPHIKWICLPSGGVVEERGDNWPSGGQEFLHHHWPQPDHQAGAPIRHGQLHVRGEEHCCQTEEHHSDCYCLWWVQKLLSLSLFDCVLIFPLKTGWIYPKPHLPYGISTFVMPVRSFGNRPGITHITFDLSQLKPTSHDSILKLE